MKKIFSLCIFLIFLTAAFMPLEHEDDQKKNKFLFKNNGTDEKWQISVNVNRHLEMTEMTASICGDPCNCTRINFQSTSDVVYSFSGETDVIPQGSDVLVMLESDKGGGDTKYSNKTITTDLCTGKSCTETSEGSGKVTSTGGYFDYKPSSKEGLLFMNYNLEGNINAIDCFGASSEIPIDGAFLITLSQPQYMNFNLSDQVDSLYKTREREYDSLKHLLPDWMPKIDFAEIEKSRQTEKDTLEKIDAKSYVDKYALKVTEKESGYIATVIYSKSIEIPKTDEYHEGYTKYTFTENITVNIGAPSDIKLKQISKDWVPEKDSLIDATVKWQGTKIPNKLKFTIYDVSNEPGECLNSESDDTSPDLEFDWDGLFDFEKVSETEIIVKPEAYSGNECTISLKSKDYGTYAKLKAEGDFGNGWVPINADETNEYYIRIPYDINLNFIADKWEKDVGVFGMNLPPTWDEDPEPANGEIGDAITLFEEYRGFFTLSPDKKHTRTDPNNKEIFVIDVDELFSVPAWKSASDIMAYRLDNSMVKGGPGGMESRIVDFNQGYAAGVHKYSVRLIKSSEIIKEGNMTVLGESLPEGSLHKTPKYWDKTVIYVDAINKLTDDVIRNLEDGKNVSDERLKEVTGLTREQLNRINELTKNASVVSTIREFFDNRTIIHEVGHSCAADHHDPITSGNLSCPMKYKDAMDSYTYIKDFLMDILEFISTSGDGETIISFGNSKFCSDPLYNCYFELRVKDD